jgi:hypothetical protein
MPPRDVTRERGWNQAKGLGDAEIPLDTLSLSNLDRVNTLLRAKLTRRVAMQRHHDGGGDANRSPNGKSRPASVQHWQRRPCPA